MTTLVNGLLGGLAAGLLASAVAVWVGPASRSSRARTVAGAGGYGAVAGAVLVALELFVLGLLGVPPTRGEALAVAVGWSALLLALTAAVRATRSDGSGWPPLRALVAFHVVYGLLLGAWIRLTWIT
ncbi:hypothetical protein [Haloarcula litorea]|uniref:hypothetical protein n=1 Tax=Haloarcula litorea TaxID=3032579 RepID=UPI0023E8EE37|nr:hypothetical protein [Halomicroarcula sp. GDY20]